jgi:hypothetical protein
MITRFSRGNLGGSLHRGRCMVATRRPKFDFLIGEVGFGDLLSQDSVPFF